MPKDRNALVSMRRRAYSLYGRRRYRMHPWGVRVVSVVAILLVIGGGYLLLLTVSPSLAISSVISSPIDLHTTDDSSDTRDRIQIAKIDLEVPFFAGTSPALLEKGAWHRYADRGNPQKGGNFILSAHRFTLGNSPGQTKTKSPFYNIHKLELGDEIRVFFQGNWYNYRITKKYDVKPDAVDIETPSHEAKLTLYSCTLKGSADGRTVVEARLE